MSVVEQLWRTSTAPLEFANIVLTTDDAVVGATPREVVWTHRKTTLYRYRRSEPSHAIPLLLVFALINRPEIFDLRPGGSFVEYLLGEGFDVFLATGLTPGTAELEVEEQDLVHRWFPRAEVEDMIRTGIITDDSSVAAYTLLLLGESAGGGVAP